MGFWQSREDPNSLEGGIRENGEYAEFQQFLTGVEAEEEKNFHIDDRFKEKISRVGKNSEKTLEAVGFWCLENGIEPRNWKKNGRKHREIGTRKNTGSGKMDPSRTHRILGLFPVGFVGFVGSHSQNSPSLF